jgi:hypothetical protein
MGNVPNRRRFNFNEEGDLQTIPEYADDNGLVIRYLNLETGDAYSNFFPSLNPIYFLEGDVSWPNFMARGVSNNRQILFSGDLRMEATSLISVNLDLFKSIEGISAIPNSGGRFALALKNKADELMILDTDGLYPRLIPDGNYLLFLKSNALHQPLPRDENRYMILGGKYRGSDGAYIIDLSKGFEPIRIPDRGPQRYNVNQMQKGQIKTVNVYQTEKGYALANVHRKPYKTWFQNQDPFIDYSRLVIDVSRRSPALTPERTGDARPGYYQDLRNKLTGQKMEVIASSLGQAGQFPFRQGDNSEGFSNFSGFSNSSFDPLLRLISRKNVYSPARQDGFSVIEMSKDGNLIDGHFFKQEKNKITMYQARLSMIPTEKGFQLLAAESDGFYLYEWPQRERTLLWSNNFIDAENIGFERVGFSGTKPMGIQANHTRSNYGRGPMSTSLQKVEYFIHLSQ